MAYQALEQLINLYDGYRKTLVVNRQELLLLQEDGKRYLVQASCPHLHWPLLQAAIENDSIYCPKHGYAFNLLTGSPVNSVAMNCKPLKTFRIVYEGSTLGIDL